MYFKKATSLFFFLTLLDIRKQCNLISMINLKEVEIQDLIGRYESELKKLTYQSEKVQETISELQSYIGIQKAAPIQKSAPKKKTPMIISPPEGVYSGTFSHSTGNTKKVKKQASISVSGASVVEILSNPSEFDLPENGAGYRLSEWDHFIIDSLKGARTTLVNNDFFKLAANRVKAQGLDMTRTQLHGKINRSIHKLTHEREMIKKIRFSGKGYAYALNEWLDDNGKLLLRYKRKSIR